MVVLFLNSFVQFPVKKTSIRFNVFAQSCKEAKTDTILYEFSTGLSLGNFLLRQYRLWSFQMGYTKLERFLPKNQHSQRKFLNFENWTNGEPQ